MREIRFRAWDGHRFYYFDNHAYTLDYNDVSGWNVHPTTPNYDKGPWTTGESSNTAEYFDLQQYTGLKDKNKKRIYEGDIVRINHPHDLTGDFTNALGVVFWWDEEGGWYHGNQAGRPPKRMWKYVEVIGNIYENPVLLPEESISE